MVFLVPASTDRISLASALRQLLTSAAGSLETIGSGDSQVLLWENVSLHSERNGCLDLMARSLVADLTF